MVAMVSGLMHVASAQESESWEGAIEIVGVADQKIEVTFTRSVDEFTGTIKIPERSPMAMPLQNLKMDGETVYFELDAAPGLAVFDGERLSAELIEGTFFQGISGLFYLEPKVIEVDNTKPPSNAVEEPVQLNTETGTIHGTLLMPDSEKAPVALLIAGSGASDRDGNASPGPGMPTLELNILKLLAVGLANEGIATVRFDKRGVGESRHEDFNEADLRFETYLDDVLGWINELKADDRFSNIFLIGHSEGALLAKLGAVEVPVSGVVSLAGAGLPADQLLLEQIENQLESFPDVSSVLKQLRSTIGDLKKGRKLSNLPPGMSDMFRESVREYLRSWFKYDPRQVASKLDVPFLVVQGTTDLQSLKGNGRKLADANPNAQLLEIDRMNHVLKESGAEIMEQMMVMSDPQAPLHKELVPAVAQFVRDSGE